MKSSWFLAIEDEVKDANIVLASQSPNRFTLLKELGIEPRVIVSGFEENLPKTLPPSKFVEETAAGKALEVAKILTEKKVLFSGVTLIDSTQRIEKFHVETKVKFGDIPAEMFREYIKSGECFNRAGAYGIQHKAAAFVESINGCYSNIVGLPIYEVVKCIRKLLLLKK
uniref:Maf-like protein n=1 Tax=Panagrolaimus sp. ES5 TaxID=591445 RepID=A0AC34FQ91_9BILA